MNPPRRYTHNALERSHEPRWLVSRTFHGAILDAQRLEPNSDLVRAFVAAILALIDSGWTVGEFGSSGGHVRYTKGSEQRMLTVERIDPEQSHKYGPAWQGQCIGCEE